MTDHPPELTDAPVPSHAFHWNPQEQGEYAVEKDHQSSSQTSHQDGAGMVTSLSPCLTCQRQCEAYDLWSLGCTM